MKKLFFISAIIFSILYSTDLSAQGDRLNMEKYWFYRYRLVNDFMVKGDCQGCSEPMNQREVYSQGSEMGKWGDQTIVLAQYLSVLATEFKLLHDHGQPTDTTVQELYYALRAFNRLDYTAELHVPGVGSGALNGFFIRDDVPSSFLNDHPKLANGVTSNRDIHNVESDFTNQIPTTKEMSNDQVWHLMQGLVLIRKCLYSGIKYHNPITGQAMPLNDGDYNTDIWQEAANINDRLIKYMKNANYDGTGLSWVVLNPNTGALVDRGWSVADKAYGAAEAACFVRDLNESVSSYMFPIHKCNTYHNPQSKLLAPVWINCGNGIGNAWQLSTEDYKFQQLAAIGNSWWNSPTPFIQNPIPMLVNTFSGWISNWPALPSGQEIWETVLMTQPIQHPTNLTSENLYNRAYARNNEHLPLLHFFLHGGNSPLRDNTYTNLLNSAPTCGPFNYNYPSNSSSYEWSSDSRVYNSERRGEYLIPTPNHNYGDDKVAPFYGEYNGLDYMLYYNLYHLIAGNSVPIVNYMDRIVTIHFPTIGMGGTGSIVNPVTIKAFNTITASNVVDFNADATYRAGNEITFHPGFQARAGAKFHAIVQKFQCAADGYRIGITNDSSNQSLADNLVAYTGQTTFVNYPKRNAADEYTSNNSDNSSIAKKTNYTEQDRIHSLSATNETVFGISIVPNPNNGTFQITVYRDNQTIGVKELKVYDMMGNAVWSSGPSSNGMFNINISVYSAGIYYVRCINEFDEIETKKIIKQ